MENTVRLPTPHREGYHFTTGMTDKAISWMRQQQAVAPDEPFFMWIPKETQLTPRPATLAA
jgi:arylsulfatase